jgi:hypothetical protein
VAVVVFAAAAGPEVAQEVAADFVVAYLRHHLHRREAEVAVETVAVAVELLLHQQVVAVAVVVIVVVVVALVVVVVVVLVALEVVVVAVLHIHRELAVRKVVAWAAGIHLIRRRSHLRVVIFVALEHVVAAVSIVEIKALEMMIEMIMPRERVV